jgi:hypothetical protein
MNILYVARWLKLIGRGKDTLFVRGWREAWMHALPFVARGPRALLARYVGFLFLYEESRIFFFEDCRIDH